MFKVSVENLYIGKSGINFEINGSIQNIRVYPARINPTTMVGELFNLHIKTDNRDPDFFIPNGFYYENLNIFLVNPVETLTNTIWVTGIPLEDSLDKYRIKDTIKESIFTDNHRKYLFQITKTNKLEYQYQL